jgi:hypothetical protein
MSLALTVAREASEDMNHRRFRPESIAVVRSIAAFVRPTDLRLSCAALLPRHLHRRVSVGTNEALQRRATQPRRDSFCRKLASATARDAWIRLAPHSRYRTALIETQGKPNGAPAAPHARHRVRSLSLALTAVPPALGVVQAMPFLPGAAAAHRAPILCRGAPLPAARGSAQSY